MRPNADQIDKWDDANKKVKRCLDTVKGTCRRHEPMMLFTVSCRVLLLSSSTLHALHSVFDSYLLDLLNGLQTVHTRCLPSKTTIENKAELEAFP